MLLSEFSSRNKVCNHLPEGLVNRRGHFRQFANIRRIGRNGPCLTASQKEGQKVPVKIFFKWDCDGNCQDKKYQNPLNYSSVH